MINPNFISGLMVPSGIAVKSDTLFVADFGKGTVGKFDAATGAAINPNFIAGLSGPEQLVLLGNTLFVANNGAGTAANSTPRPGSRLTPTSLWS